MRAKPLVFISSTSDLVEERQALAQALRPTFEPYLFEEDRARRSTPEERLRMVIEDSDVFVIVLGAAYGTALPSDAEGRSIVEWEFDSALARPELELMAFTKAGARGVASSTRQQAFLTRVSDFRGGSWCKSFTGPSELPPLVLRSLMQWLAEFYQRMKLARGRLRVFTHRRLLPVAVGAAGLSVAAGVGRLISPAAVLAVCGLSFVVILICLALYRIESGGSNVGELDNL